jgi:hypothetical protein
MAEPNTQKPVAIAVFVSIVLCAFVFILIGSLVADYALMVHYYDTIQAHQALLQIKQSIPTCRALVHLDQASSPPVVNASTNPLSYGHKLAVAIHQVVVSTHCIQILNGTFRP